MKVCVCAFPSLFHAHILCLNNTHSLSLTLSLTLSRSPSLFLFLALSLSPLLPLSLPLSLSLSLFDSPSPPSSLSLSPSLTLPPSLSLVLQGGTFELDIQIPESYPFSPPKVCVCLVYGVVLLVLRAFLFFLVCSMARSHSAPNASTCVRHWANAAPSQVKFTTRLWHPNISSQTGAICLDILKDQWCGTLSSIMACSPL